MSPPDREGQSGEPPSETGPSGETESVISADQESLTSQYAAAYGRPYYSAGNIFLPFDETEQRRLDSLHRLLRVCLDGELTVVARIMWMDRIEVVDIGTGTGRWAVEMAARYPGATIIGMDIAPIQARLVPENVRFEIADVETPWGIEPGTVDFIQVRALAGMIRDWPALAAQAFEKLKPGGLFEITDIRGKVLDFDGKFGEDEITPNLTKLFQQMAANVGTIFDPAPRLPGWLHDEAFEKVAQQTEIIPLGRWPRDKKLRAREKLATAMVLPWFRTYICST
ncbi:putative umta methyltransferase family protein [Eutypa lata UCREL1]|uniref:Putative umta methyltransferase family protein n=1 Tax=Eutypa lata (strain UCR-EL1) TaxID=1287681 RepID=M7SRN7_EUTLA|nr:putative umta methyltransferase family protein [Eutypa lata UCREL1]